MKKHLWFMLSLTAIILLLTACASEPSSSVTPNSSDAETTTAAITVNDTETTRPTETTAETTVPITGETEETKETEETEEPSLIDRLRGAGCPEELLVTAEREITADEAAAFDAFLQTNGPRRYIAGDLTTDGFFRPEDASLFNVLYAFGYQNEVSDAERDAFAAVYPFDLHSITKITAADLAADVQKYLGISVTQDMIDRFLGVQEDASHPYVYYLEEYDAYYMTHSDTNVGDFAVKEGCYTTDGRYLLLLYSPQDHGCPRIALYDPVEDGYQIDMLLLLPDVA